MKKIKKLISISLAAVSAFSLILPSYAAARQPGDINNDGKVTVADARIAMRSALDIIVLGESDIVVGDIDRDGTVSVADARLIMRKAVGIDIEENAEFNKTLYEVAHPLVGSYKPIFTGALNPLKNLQKWCCLYTIHDVFRPTLEKLGYSKAEIDLLAPDHYDKEDLAAAMKNGMGISSPIVMDSLPYYVPSLLMNHYYKHPEICTVYNFFDYYDDIVTASLFYRDEDDVDTYYPRVGDVLFMSNKTKTYANGYPTIDHTAQIIEVYADGTFLCTEGSIIEPAEGDNIAKVRERTYHYNPAVGTWEFDYNPVVIVLTAVRPYL